VDGVLGPQLNSLTLKERRSALQSMGVGKGKVRKECLVRGAQGKHQVELTHAYTHVTL